MVVWLCIVCVDVCWAFVLVVLCGRVLVIRDVVCGVCDGCLSLSVCVL